MYNIIYLHTCEQTSKRDPERPWWPLSCRPDKKFSFKATSSGTTLLYGDRKGHPSDERARTMALGVCLSWCVPYLPSDSLWLWDRSGSFSLFLTCTLWNIGTDKPTVHCGIPRAIPANRARRMTILLWKSETLGWIEPLFNGGWERHGGTGTVSLRVLNVYRPC